MLVLSRGNNDKVVFPTLGISVEILRIAGNKVRLGIDAPREIPVHRHEIVDRDEEIAPQPVTQGRARSSRESLSHNTRNRLHTASLALQVLHRKLENDDNLSAEAEIFKIFNELKAIEEELGGEPASRSEEKRIGGYRTLVVEDDANERELLSEFLRLSGFEVETAVDGLQAMVHLTKRDRPDVVLLDMKMPRLDGSRTISAIRGNPDYRGLKVFAVTGTDRSELNVTIGSEGVDRWFSKPLNANNLVAAIHEELSGECIPS